jgi:hypothetical protein
VRFRHVLIGGCAYPAAAWGSRPPSPRCHSRNEAPPHSCRSLTSCSSEEQGQRDGQGADMKQRLWFSLALLAVLFCFWLVMTKPMCREGFVAVLGIRSGWSCVADGT